MRSGDSIALGYQTQELNGKTINSAEDLVGYMFDRSIDELKKSEHKTR